MQKSHHPAETPGPRRMRRKKRLSLSCMGKNESKHTQCSEEEVSQPHYGVSDHIWVTQGKTEHHAVIEAIDNNKPGKCHWLVKWVVQGSTEWIEVELDFIRPYFQPLMERRSSKKHKLFESREKLEQEMLGEYCSSLNNEQEPSKVVFYEEPSTQRKTPYIPIESSKSKECYKIPAAEQKNTAQVNNEKSEGTTSYQVIQDPHPICTADEKAYSKKSPRGSPYLQHLEDCMTYVFEKRKDFVDLFTQDEKNLAKNVLSPALPPAARFLFAKLFLRRGPWFRAADALAYGDRIRLDFGDEDNDDGGSAMLMLEEVGTRTTPAHRGGNGNAVAKALAALRAAGLLEALPSLAPGIHSFAKVTAEGEAVALETGLEAAACCLRVAELRSVVRRLGGAGAAGATREELLAELRERVRTQRTVFGRPLPLIAEMKKQILESVDWNAQNSTNQKDLRKSLEWAAAFRLAPPAVALVRRALRLLHAARCTSAVSSGRTTATPSVHMPAADFTAGLLVLFNKIKYPDYQCLIKTTVFQTRLCFLRWEFAVELGHVMDKAIAIEKEARKEERPTDNIDDQVLEFKQQFGSLVSIAPNIYNDLPPLSYTNLDGTEPSSFKEDSDGDTLPRNLYYDVMDLASKCLLCGKISKERGKTQSFPKFLLQLHPEWLLSTLIWEGTHLLEKQREYEKAIKMLEAVLESNSTFHRRGRCANRRALDLQHLGRPGEALAACRAALADPHVKGGDRIEIEKRYTRLQKQGAGIVVSETHESGLENQDQDDVDFTRPISSKNNNNESIEDPCGPQPGGDNQSGLAEDISNEHDASNQFWTVDTILGNRLNIKVGQKNRFVGFGEGHACSVESLVLQHYRRAGGWWGMHNEGRPLRALFALLLWGPLFSADVPDVFQCPYQDAPLDLDFPDLFYENRKALIDEVISRIENSTLVELTSWIEKSWNDNFGTVCRGIHWQSNSLHLLQVVAACLGGPSLSKILKVFCTNYKHFSGGMPDLLLFRIQIKPMSDASRVRDDLVASQQTCQTASKSNIAAKKRNQGDEAHSAFEWFQSIAEENMEIKRLGGDLPKGKGLTEMQTTESPAEPKMREEAEKDDWDATDCVSKKEGHDISIADEIGRTVGLVFGQELEYSAMMVEVKGPSDKLSSRQIKWLNLLAREAGVDTRVCRVGETTAAERLRRLQRKGRDGLH